MVSGVDTEYRRRAADDFLLFMRGLIIPSASGPQLFDSCIAPFQLDCFQLLAPSLHAIRDGTAPPHRRFWLERTKKASKDADIAICLLWLMAFPRRPILVQVSAANQQQSGIIKRRAADLLYYNPWLGELAEIQQNRIYGAGRIGEVVIEATGSSGAKQGDTPDLLILNELVHVDKWAVNETHMNNADGVPRGVVIISTNAGYKGTKAETWRDNARENPRRWTLHIWNKPAPWVNDSDLADAKRRNLVGEYDRLWCGRWTSGKGGALTEDVIEQCFPRGTFPLDGPQVGWDYVAGLDLGVSHDHSGLVVVGIKRDEQRCRVAWFRGWEPSMLTGDGKQEVNLQEVESACVSAHKLFGVEWFGYDPAAGGSFMAQRLRGKNVPMREMSFASPTNMTEMAQSFVQLSSAGKLVCYDDEDGRLRRDFGKFNIVAKTNGGYKLESVSDEHGHADVGTALVICLPKVMAMLGRSSVFSSEDDLACDSDKPLNENERKEMPEELREIYGYYDEMGKRRGHLGSGVDFDDDDVD